MPSVESVSLVLIFSLPVMLAAVLAVCQLPCFMVKRNQRATFPTKQPPRFAAEIRTRARRRAWPFGASRRPRPQYEAAQGENGEAEEEASIGGYGTFAGFDGVQAAAYLDVCLGDPFVVPQPDVTTPVYEPSIERSWRSDYTYVRRLAETKDGYVDLMQHAGSGSLVAVKCVPTRRKDGKWIVPEDVTMLKEHTKPHSNIVECLGFHNEHEPGSEYGKGYVLQAYCDGGYLWDLKGHTRDMRGTLPPMFILHVLTSVSDALAYLNYGFRRDAEPESGYRIEDGHLPVLHQDVKPDNIFMRWSETSEHGMPDIILGDLGCASLECNTTGLSGTYGFFAPELEEVIALEDTDPEAHDVIMAGQNNTMASDIFAFGMTLLHLLLVEHWDGYPTEEDIQEAAEGFGEDPKGQQFLASILTRCLADDPEERCTAYDLFLWSTQLKPMIAGMYEQGQRMPANAWPPPRTSRFESARREGTVSSLHSEGLQGAAASSTNGDVSQVSGFTDDFCWCPNHRDLSDRRPEPGCVREEQRVHPLPSQAAATTVASLIRSGADGAGAGAESGDIVRAGLYQVQVVSRFSEDSEC